MMVLKPIDENRGMKKALNNAILVAQIAWIDETARLNHGIFLYIPNRRYFFDL